VNAKFVWSMPQQKEFEDMMCHLYSPPVFILLDLQRPFEIETNDSYYVINAIITQHGHLVAYRNETLFDTFRRYPTYEKDVYSIM
jgi:hypothetical protein